MPSIADIEVPDDHRNITKSDATTYNPPFKGIHVGTAGTVVITAARTGVDATYTAAAGSYILIRGSKVKAASTGSNFVAVFNA